MKKFSIIKLLTAVFLVAVTLTCAVSCNKNVEEINYDGDGMVATVIEAHENYLLVAPREDAPEARSSDRFSVPNYFTGRVKKGDTVIIEHDGMIQETYPASFHKIFSMTLVGDDGENETVCID